MLLPDVVDSDINTLPVGDGVVVDVAARPTAFFANSAAGLEAAAAGLAVRGSSGAYASPAAPSAAASAAVEVTPLGGSPLGSAPLAGSPLAFVAGDSRGLAQRAATPRERAGRAGMPRSGSHGHLAHLHPRLSGAQAGEAAAEEAEAQRRKERAEAAATAAAEHRDSKLTEKRRGRAALGSEEAEVCGVGGSGMGGWDLGADGLLQACCPFSTPALRRLPASILHPAAAG